MSRSWVLTQVLGQIRRIQPQPVLRVAIDGVDGAGKTTLAHELGALLLAQGVPVIRASVDGFHHPRVLRYRQGKDSPLGFFEDSYDYSQLKANLLDPLSPGGNLAYRPAVFDHRLDQRLDLPWQQAQAGAVLLLDGIFLHRPELRSYWDFSLFLDVPFAVSVARLAQRDGSDPDPEAPGQRRYVQGQQMYLQRCEPWRWARVVLDNSDLAAPFLKKDEEVER